MKLSLISEQDLVTRLGQSRHVESGSQLGEHGVLNDLNIENHPALIKTRCVVPKLTLLTHFVYHSYCIIEPSGGAGATQIPGTGLDWILVAG